MQRAFDSMKYSWLHGLKIFSRVIDDHILRYFSLDYLKTSFNNYHQIDGYHRYNALLFLILKVIL